MSYISFYNSKNNKIRHTIVLDFDDSDISAIDKITQKLNPPKPYFYYNHETNWCSSNCDLELLRNACCKRNIKKSGSKSEIIDRIILDNLGLKQHTNGKLYRKLLASNSLLPNKRNIYPIHLENTN